MLQQAAEFAAVLSCGLFTGAALYITLVEHPARMECGVEIAATVFAPSYRRATALQVPLASLALLSSTTAWLSGATSWWVVGGALLGAVIPFTLVIILPTNRKLLCPTLDRRSAQAGELLSRWAFLHAVRTIIGLLSLMLFLYLLVFRPTSRSAPASTSPARISRNTNGSLSSLSGLPKPSTSRKK